jgi:hypothetical protein
LLIVYQCSQRPCWPDKDLDWVVKVTGTVELNTVVGRCRLTASKTVLKAPMVSALDTII